jgi:solute carrier family 25 thiamine pyrophosphate transporter 19
MVQSSKEHSALHGAIAGLVSRTCIAPLDVIKIRLQVQNKFFPHYDGMLDAFKKIKHEEGVLALWKGNASGLIFYGTYGAVQFYVYDHLSRYLKNSFVTGAIAATAATVITYPFDIMRTRLSLRQNAVWGSTLILDVIRQEGMKTALFKGLGPTVIQVTPYMGTVFASYELVKEIIGPVLPASLTDFLAGAIAGINGKLVTMPFDVVRKRLQIQNNLFHRYELQHLQKFTSLKHCVAYTWINEGITGFYKGLLVSLVKSVPATAITFTVYGLLNRIHQ